MHAYLPAIGFGQIKKKSQLQQLLSSVQNFPDQVQKIRLDEESSLVVYTKEVAPGIGLMICGEEDMQGSFQMEYYEPYINSNVCSSKAECSIEKESAREAYDGVCDDCRLGLNLIFSVNNFMEYRKYKAYADCILREQSAGRWKCSYSRGSSSIYGRNGKNGSEEIKV